MIFFLFYFFLFYLFLFTPLEHVTVLTINEEIFIIISFFIFIDLFGYKLINFVSNFTNSLQQQIYKQFLLIYLVQLVAFSNLLRLYATLTSLFTVAKIFYKKLYLEISKLDLQRQVDFNLFLANFLNFQNRALGVFESNFLFAIFKFFLFQELPKLESELILQVSKVNTSSNVILSNNNLNMMREFAMIENLIITNFMVINNVN
jgi:hypothetical protein